MTLLYNMRNIPVTISVKCTDSPAAVLLSQHTSRPASSRLTSRTLSNPPTMVDRAHMLVFSIGVSCSWCSRNHLFDKWWIKSKVNQEQNYQSLMNSFDSIQRLKPKGIYYNAIALSSKSKETLPIVKLLVKEQYVLWFFGVKCVSRITRLTLIMKINNLRETYIPRSPTNY